MKKLLNRLFRNESAKPTSSPEKTSFQSRPSAFRTRWEYPINLNEDEQAVRDYYLARFSEWWKLFAKVNGKIIQSIQDRDFETMTFLFSNIQEKVHPGLFWEVSVGSAPEKWDLIITPESNFRLRPFVNEMLSHAPTLPQWQFWGYRQPCPYESVLQIVQGRQQSNFAALQFQLDISANNKVDVSIIIPAETSPGEERNLLGAAFLGLEALLGEEIIEKWLGTLRMERIQLPNSPLILAPAVAESFRNKIAEIKYHLPEEPSWKYPPTEQVTVFQMEPNPNTLQVFQSDIQSYLTLEPEIFRAIHSNGSFSSLQYSNHQELFCYIKWADLRADNEARLETRNTIFEQLEVGLRDAEAGITIGQALGLKHSYVDLVIGNKEHALAVIKEVLSEYPLITQVWLYFHDTNLTMEWIPLKESTLAPIFPPDILNDTMTE